MQRGLFFASVVLCILGAALPAPGEPGEGRNFYNLGVFAYEDGAFDDAEFNLLRAVQLEPDNPYIHHYLGKTYLTRGWLPKAEVHLSRAWEIDPEIPELRSDLAALHFQQSNYTRAAALYGEVAEQDPSDVLANYNAGISLFREDRFEAAAGRLLEAADRSPSVRGNAYYYVGLCYQELGEIDQAAEKFAYVRDHAESSSLRKSAENALWALKARARAERRFRFYGRLGAGYDDNVRLSPGDEDLAAKEGDAYLQAYLSGRYDLVRGDVTTFGVGYNHSQTVYEDLTEFNLIGATPNLYAQVRHRALTYGFRYLPSFYWLDGDTYLQRHQLRPELQWKLGKRVVSLLAYAYERDDYQSDDGRDGDAHLGSLDLVYGFGGRTTFLRLGGTYKSRSADSPDQEYQQWTARGGLGFELLAGVQATVKARYYWKDYDNVDSDFETRREDRNLQAGLTLERALFTDWLGWLVEYSYTRSDSNIDSFDYDRNQVSLSLTARY
ncbi:MAG: surface lipoprotein assembly modifier [Deferrisomatales bacterium]|nr:surface lipoprotein assembly modifier [Deferrisomatales bacterium]